MPIALWTVFTLRCCLNVYGFLLSSFAVLRLRGFSSFILDGPIGFPELRSAFPDISFKLCVQAIRPQHTALWTWMHLPFSRIGPPTRRILYGTGCAPDTLTFGHQLPKFGSKEERELTVSFSTNSSTISWAFLKSAAKNADAHT